MIFQVGLAALEHTLDFNRGKAATVRLNARNSSFSAYTWLVGAHSNY